MLLLILNSILIEWYEDKRNKISSVGSTWNQNSVSSEIRFYIHFFNGCQGWTDTAKDFRRVETEVPGPYISVTVYKRVLTPPSFRALTLKRYMVPGSRLPTVHSSSGPWYTSEATSSGSVISTLYSETSQPLSEAGTSGKGECFSYQNTFVFPTDPITPHFPQGLQNIM